MSLKFKRFSAVLKARNKEFIRDRATLGWNVIMPILLIAGLAFAFSKPDQALFKVGYLGQPPSANSFFQIRHIDFIAFKDLDKAMVKVERHQIDMLVDIPGHRFWINDTNPKGSILEHLIGAGTDKSDYTKATVTGRAVRYVDWLLPGILGMNMMFSALFGVGYVIVRYRKNGMLKRLKATPLTAFEFLTAQVISRLWLILLITAIVFVGTNFLLHFAMHGSYLNLLLVFTLGSMCMISLGLLSASRLASEELAGGLLNLLTWPMMFLSGVWFSLEGSPEILKQIALLLPLTHVIDAARAIMIDGAGLAQVAPHLVVLAVLTLVFLLLGSRLFRWE